MVEGRVATDPHFDVSPLAEAHHFVVNLELAILTGQFSNGLCHFPDATSGPVLGVEGVEALGVDREVAMGVPQLLGCMVWVVVD